MRKTTILCVAAILTMLATPGWATSVNLTTSGLGLNSGNYGQQLVVNDIIRINAITHIGQPSCGPGTVYLNGEYGLGVQNASKGGSKGISGGGGDQDERLVLDFTIDLLASSIIVGLTNYKAKDDDPVIRVNLSSGSELVFTESHTNWNAAVTLVESERILVNIGTLLGPGFNGSARSVSVTEVTGHVYVNSISYEPIPEPATVMLLGLGGLTLARKRKLQSNIFSSNS